MVDESVRGDKPEIEKEQQIKSDQVVKRAYRKQESLGWGNLAKGRAVKRLVEIQEDWSKRGEAQFVRKEDEREIVVKSLVYVLLFLKEMWKVRCCW